MYRILFREDLVPQIHLFEVAAPAVAKKAQAGQFVIIRLDEKGERVPLTLADWDDKKGTVTLVFMEVGATSRKLALLNVGDSIANLVGPLGLASDIEKFGSVVCVAGGVGVAPIVPIAHALKQAGNKVISIMGARNKDLLFWEDKLREVSNQLIVTTDDGTYGHKALVTEPLKELLEKVPMFLGIPGENLNGIYSANEFLTRINLMKAYRFPEYDTPVKVGKRVAVIGGGNVAMDSARCALRLGAEHVYIVYRRSEEEMPARREELENAKEEGIEFKVLTNPKRFVGNEQGWLTGMECYVMELGEPDESGRRRPIVKPGSEFVLDVDVAVVALGTTPNPLIAQTTRGLETTHHGTVTADEVTGRTAKPGVWAGGDIVTGSATVISAMGAGKRAAADIDKFLRG